MIFIGNQKIVGDGQVITGSNVTINGDSVIVDGHVVKNGESYNSFEDNGAEEIWNGKNLTITGRNDVVYKNFYVKGNLIINGDNIDIKAEEKVTVTDIDKVVVDGDLIIDGKNLTIGMIVKIGGTVINNGNHVKFKG